MSSKRAQRRRSCENKRRYTDRAVAAQVAAALTRQNGVLREHYWCRNCFGFHVGHTPSKGAQGVRQPQSAPSRKKPAPLPPYEVWVQTLPSARDSRKYAARVEKRELNQAIARWEDEGGAAR